MSHERASHKQPFVIFHHSAYATPFSGWKFCIKRRPGATFSLRELECYPLLFSRMQLVDESPAWNDLYTVEHGCKHHREA